MAQQLVTEDGVSVLPGVYFRTKVQKNNSGLGTSGVLVFIGEADAGPDFTQEPDLTQNFYGPTEAAAVLAKYKSGPLVDAFINAVTPANDPEITGAPSAIFLVKTNTSGKATTTLVRSGLVPYATLADKSYGDLGNFISGSVTAAQEEVAPATGPFTFVPTPSTASLGIRVNGGTLQTVAVTALQAPSAFVGAFKPLPGIMATGGIDRGVLTGIPLSATLALVANGKNVTITLGGAASWSTIPSVGDTLIIPGLNEYGVTEASVLAGAGSANLGAYVVTGATATTITATKLRNNTVGSVSDAVNVSGALGSVTGDILCFSPVNIQNMTGANRGVLTGLTGRTVAGTAIAGGLRLTLETGYAWATLPQVNDFLYIPSTAPSTIRGASDVNVGWYRVTAATSGVAAGASTITLTRLSNGTAATFAATAISTIDDIQVMRPVIDGRGKALELFDNAGTDNVDTLFYALSASKSNFLSTPAAPKLLVSASEYKVSLNINPQSDAGENIVAGGEVVFAIGYNGTYGTLTIKDGVLTTTVIDGNGTNLNVQLSRFKTLGDLATYINSQTGYTAKVTTALYGQLPVMVNGKSVLDEMIGAITSTFGSAPGRIKRDAYAFFKAMSEEGSIVQLGLNPVQANSGLPEVQGTFYLAGGTRGGTTAAKFSSALAACEKLRANAIIPLFSRDATEDIADGLTDSSSDYTIAAVHAAVKSHVIKMSSFKRRRPRQGFLSFRGSFSAAKEAANNVANYRCSMTFQDVKALASDGTIAQFQPWMGAVLAAAMQAAGFYRSILFKGINCSGVLVADGSFSDADDADLEGAVKNGLLAAQRVGSGGFRWNTDQTTYAVDGNFVYNSIQAIYTADLVATTTAERMERAFVGQSLADVSASVALSYLKGIMSDLKRAKLIVGDDEAPLGFSSARIEIAGNTMRVSVTIKLATAIVFIPITFLVNEVRSTAQ